MGEVKENQHKGILCGEYLVIANKMLGSLNLGGCPFSTQKIFDKILWFALQGNSLAKVLTIEEAFEVDQWMSKNFEPEDFPGIVKKSLENELDIKFGKSEELAHEKRMEIWKKLFSS